MSPFQNDKTQGVRTKHEAGESHQASGDRDEKGEKDEKIEKGRNG